MCNTDVPTLLFCSGDGIIGKLIRIFTNPRTVFRGGFVPSHVATLYKGHVIEADVGKVCNEQTYPSWMAGRKGQKIIGCTPKMAYPWMEVWHRYQEDLGKPYEDLREMPGIILDKNDDDADRLFCSELVMRRFPKRLLPRKDSPDNTSPDEIYRHILKHSLSWWITKVA